MLWDQLNILLLVKVCPLFQPSSIAWKNGYCAILMVIFYFSHPFLIYYWEFFCKEDLYNFSHLCISYLFNPVFISIWISSVQFSRSVMSSSLQPHESQYASSHKLMSIESVMPSNHLILCRSLLLPPLIFLSIRVFSNESGLRIRWPKDWSFRFSINPSSEYSGLISFTIDWFDFLAIQGTLKSLLQQHSSKASILQCSAFFLIQNHSFD